MSDSVSSASEVNAYSAGTSVDDSSVPSEVRLWMTPAIIIMAVVWALLIIPGMIAPLTIMHFVSLQGAGVLGTLSLTLWWLLSRGVPGKTRLLGYVTILAITIATFMLMDKSLGITMLIYGLPTALTILIGSLTLLRTKAWPTRSRVSLAAFTAFMVAIQFVRIGQIDAAFAFSLVPRWIPTAEDKFLASLQDDQPTAENQSSEAEPTDATELVNLPNDVSDTDWAEFRGPRRDGVLPGVTFAKDWETTPPKEIWRSDVGPGWSSFCIVGDVLFTQEQRGEQEVVVAYSALTGKSLWITSNEGRFEASMGGVGPRATPTYHDGRLYVTGANGLIQCLDAKTGNVIWSFDGAEGREAAPLAWGFASSPLIHQGKVLVVTSGGDGQGAVALDQEDGSVIWRAGHGSHTYSSCQLETIDSVQQALVVSDWGVEALDPDTGEVIWGSEWLIDGMPRVVQPLVVGNTVYLGTGYGNGTRRIDVAKQDDGSWSVNEDWTANLKPYFNDMVYHQGHIYGFDGPIMLSIDAETGDKNWKGGRYGHGQALLLPAMDAILVIGEKGELALVDASPEKFVELAQMQVLEGITWNHPVIVGNRLYVRNAEQMACYELPEE
ncbi:PQQ-like beta-propeller repeat protein [Rubripirellula amarantea]|nr:PQQ-like beta-propeller repeat protein [Rubripirellula amarantea]